MTAPLKVNELTPRGRGGVTVLEVRGKGSLDVIISLAPSLPKMLRRKPEALLNAVLVRLRATCDFGEEDLDEALVWQRSDDCIELHLHGSPVLVGRVIELLGGKGDAHFSNAEGERKGALKRRAEQALAHAASDAAARILLDQSEGALTRALDTLRGMDEEARTKSLVALADSGRIAASLFHVPTVVLAGPVNAGKSTLFNLLVGHERVVVSGEEGTTRDAVRARVRLGAYAVDLVDTAGAREAVGEAADVEREGQAQGAGEAASADLIFWVSQDATAQVGEMPQGVPVVRLASKNELALESAVLSVSAHEKPAEARETVEAAFLQALSLPLNPWTPGAPVPFDPQSRAAIDSILAAPDQATVVALLEDLLRNGFATG